MKHYLMLKTHNITGLKYLCKTSTANKRRPFYYKGSGTYWKQHLEKHGSDISTTILEVCDTKQELTKKGIYYSKKFNVVESNEYANLVEERGDGGPTFLGKKLSKEGCERKSKSHRKFWKAASDEYRKKRKEINSKCHEKYRYYTPAGVFTNAWKAAEANNCSNVTILNRCLKDNNKPITSRKYWRFGWKDKTWRQLGWSCELLKP